MQGSVSSPKGTEATQEMMRRRLGLSCLTREWCYGSLGRLQSSSVLSLQEMDARGKIVSVAFFIPKLSTFQTEDLSHRRSSLKLQEHYYVTSVIGIDKPSGFQWPSRLKYWNMSECAA